MFIKVKFKRLCYNLPCDILVKFQRFHFLKLSSEFFYIVSTKKVTKRRASVVIDRWQCTFIHILNLLVYFVLDQDHWTTTIQEYAAISPFSNCSSERNFDICFCVISSYVSYKLDEGISFPIECSIVLKLVDVYQL